MSPSLRFRLAAKPKLLLDHGRGLSFCEAEIGLRRQEAQSISTASRLQFSKLATVSGMSLPTPFLRSRLI